MRYYELDTDGRVVGDFARPQPRRTLEQLEDRPSRFHRWDGSAWVEDAEVLLEEASARLRIELRERLLDELIEKDASLAAAKTTISADRERRLQEIKDQLRGNP